MSSPYICTKCGGVFDDLHSCPGTIGIKPVSNYSEKSNGVDSNALSQNKTDYDPVQKPLHYHKGGIDVIEFIKDKVSREALSGFYQINVLKYVTRYQDKNGIQDLKKAEFYLTKLIELENKKDS